MQEFKGSLYKSMEDPHIDLTNVNFFTECFCIFICYVMRLTILPIKPSPLLLGHFLLCPEVQFMLYSEFLEIFKIGPLY